MIENFHDRTFGFVNKTFRGMIYNVDYDHVNLDIRAEI